MAIKIVSSLKMVQIFFVTLFITIALVEARRRSAGLSRRQATTLSNSLNQSDHKVQHQIELQPTLTESVRLSCSRRYNESIDSLTDSLIHLNQTGNPPKNETAYIENWVKEAERNETNCLSQSTTSVHANNSLSSGTKFSAFSYVFSSLLHISIALVVLQVFDVY